jgi:UTP--glucose-1-phosphate uridylyltransferase
MKTVIPAAGLGTRFLPLTKEQPKEMLPVVDRPAIHWVVEEAIAAGATDILIITGREKRVIEDYFDGSSHWDHYLKGTENHAAMRSIAELSSKADIHYIRQKEPRGLGDAILQAQKHVGSEPFLVILGDTINIGTPPVARQLWEAFERSGHSIIAVESVRKEKVSDYGIVEPGEWIDDRTVKVKDLIEKPGPEEAPSNIGITGTYVLTPSVFDALRVTSPGRNGEIQLTDGLRILLRTEPIYGYRFDGRRYDIGTKMDWFRTHVELTLLDEEFREPALRNLREVMKDD